MERKFCVLCELFCALLREMHLKKSFFSAEVRLCYPLNSTIKILKAPYEALTTSYQLHLTNFILPTALSYEEPPTTDY